MSKETNTIISILLIGLMTFSAVFSVLNFVADDKEVIMPTMPTAEEIALAVSNVSVTPEVTEVSSNQAMIDRLCELTDGCSEYAVLPSKANILKDELSKNKNSDFFEKFAVLSGIDEEYLTILDTYYKDKEAKVYTEDDLDEENFQVKCFAKVKFKDNDEEDYEYMYVLAEATLDEGNLDEYTLSEVERTFEFD